MRLPGVLQIPPDFYSGEYDTEALNPISNYGCLSHFWQCKEVGAVGSTITWTDSKGGLTSQIVTETDAPDGVKINPATNSGKAIVGAYSTFNVTDLMLVLSLFQSSSTTNGIVLGSATTARLCKLAPAAASTTYEDGSHFATGTATTGLANVVNMLGSAVKIASTGNNDIAALQLLDSGVYSKITGTSNKTLTAMPTVSAAANGITMNSAMSNLYGLAIFKFTGGVLPGDIAEAMAWMKIRWMAGNKVIWPGWRAL